MEGSWRKPCLCICGPSRLLEILRISLDLILRCRCSARGLLLPTPRRIRPVFLRLWRPPGLELPAITIRGLGFRVKS